MASVQLQNETLDMDTTKTFKLQYEDMLRGFLRDISFKIPSSRYDPSIESAVLKYFRSRDFTPDFIQRYTSVIHAGVWIATSTYPFVPAKVQEEIAIYTSLVVMVEDASKEYLTDIKLFQDRLFRKQPQPIPLLETTIHSLHTLRGLYGPFISDMMMKATLEFISVCAFEQEYNEIFSDSSSTPEFPYYLRLKTGLAEVYAFFAFPECMYPEEVFLRMYLPTVPYIVRYLNLGNDFLSFYKESIVSDERLNYVHNYSRANDLTPIQVLQDTCSSLANCVRIVRKALAADPQLCNHFEQFFHGYVAYHFGAGRYKLSELGIPEIDQVREHVCCPRY
ncbi:putative trichodiene synthase [Annulohypoxylon moriforme]|nr:putative trichodiene synthase [Annulohypoxylon moriforme]